MDPASKSARFVDLQLPDTKEAIENYVLARTLENGRTQGVELYALVAAPVRNQENDFDFALPAQTGQEYLDLIEIRPASWVRGKHGSAPGSYRNGGFADAILGEITRKAKKYALRRPGAPCVHLLMYPTDWRLSVGDSVRHIISAELMRMDLGWKSVVLYQPHSDLNGTVSRLFPATEPARSRAEVLALRRQITLLADLTDFEVGPDGSVTVPVIPPPKSVR